LRLWLSRLALASLLCLPSRGQQKEDAALTPFLATAYATDGTTKSGEPTRPGTVAADTDVLPLGTKIRVTHAGAQSGIYTVTDTGSKVRGRHIDIFLPGWNRAKEFGRKIVQVTVLKWGDWEKRATAHK
jgi:3D (Asp-Asp-Asp) domain-containing protein